MPRQKRGHSSQQKIALNRINVLLAEAKSAVKVDVGRAKRYVVLARKLATKFRVRPAGFRRMFCRGCSLLFVPGVTYVVRLRPGKIIYHCNSCKTVARFGR